MMLGISIILLIVSTWLLVRVFVEKRSLGIKIWTAGTFILWVYLTWSEIAKTIQ